MREEFCVWYNKEAERNEFGNYKNPWTEARWEAFQAAYQLQQTKLDKAASALELFQQHHKTNWIIAGDKAERASLRGALKKAQQTLLEIKEIKI